MFKSNQIIPSSFSHFHFCAFESMGPFTLRGLSLPGALPVLQGLGKMLPPPGSPPWFSPLGNSLWHKLDFTVATCEPHSTAFAGRLWALTRCGCVILLLRFFKRQFRMEKKKKKNHLTVAWSPVISCVCVWFKTLIGPRKISLITENVKTQIIVL